MKTRTKVCGTEPISAWDAVRQAIRADASLEGLSPEESAILAGQLTQIVARVERVRALGPAFAGVEVSRDVHDLLARLEVGSGLETGIH